MHKFTLISLAFVFVGCSTTPEYRENVEGLIEYELDDSLNKLTTQHLACYICETGTTPTLVSQLDRYQAKTPECKEIFIGKPFDFLDPNIATYNIEAREWEDRIVLDFKPSKSDQHGLVQSMSMPVLHSELGCSYNKSINFAPTVPDSQSIASAAGY